MYAQVKKPKGNGFSIASRESQAVESLVVQKKNNVKQGFVFEDNRTGLALQRKLKALTEKKPTIIVNDKVQIPEVMQRVIISHTSNIIQRAGIDNIEALLLKPAPDHVEKTGRFKVSARLDGINNKLKGNIGERERLEAYKRILTNGHSYDAMVRAHELAKKLPTEELTKVLPTDPNVQYERSVERGKKRVEFARKHSDSELGGKRDNIDNIRARTLIERMKTAVVTFNFNYGATNKWTMPRMLNSFEVLKHHDVMSGNLDGYVKNRDEVESKQFGIRRGMDHDLEQITNDKEKAKKLNDKVPPDLRPKYAALNFAGYSQGAAPSKYYGYSHMQFKNAIKERCTITGGDSLGEAEGMAGLAFPLTEDGVKGLVEYCSRKEDSMVKWRSLDTQGPDKIVTEGENANNPDWNFIEVQIHGDVVYKKDVDKIVIASSELGVDSKEQAIENMKKITGVDNVIVE